MVEYRAIGSSLTFTHNEFELVSENQLKFYQFVSKFLDVSNGDRPQKVYLFNKEIKKKYMCTFVICIEEIDILMKSTLVSDVYFPKQCNWKLVVLRIEPR